MECDGLSVAGINVWTGCWGGSCRAKRCGRVCAETACGAHKRSRAFSRRYVCDVSRANQSVPGIRAARSRVARIALRTRVPRGAMHSDVHLTLYGAGAQNQRSSTGEILLSHTSGERTGVVVEARRQPLQSPAVPLSTAVLPEGRTAAGAPPPALETLTQ